LAVGTVRSLLAEVEAEPAPFLAVVHAVHDAQGYLAPEDVAAIAAALKLPTADVFGALSFYYYLHQGSEPSSLVGVCDGPACRLAGSDRLAERVRRQHGIGEDGRSADRRRRYRDFPCAGLCDWRPVRRADGRCDGEGKAGNPLPAGTHGAAWPIDSEKAIFRFADADLRRLDAYRAAGGYAALRKVERGGDPAGLIEAVADSGLTGRGGAGFPLARKLAMVQGAAGEEKYVVCNADEGEPGTFKDRAIMECLPHLLLEGMAIAGYAVSAGVGIIYLRYEYPYILDALRRAVEEAQAAGVLGDFRVYVRRGAGAYVCGEETSLLNSLEGRRPWPRERPPYPTERGLFGRPTLVNNVETLAAIPAMVEGGAAWFRPLGRAGATGTKLYSLSGAVRRPCNFELPLGVTARQLIFQHGGGTLNGRALKAFTLGGVSGGLLPPDALDTPLDYAGPARWGGTLGSGGIIVYDEASCLVDAALVHMRFFEKESCGKCFPCRIGTVRYRELLEELCGARERETSAGDALSLFQELAAAMTHASACGLGMAAPLTVTSLARHWPHEVESHVRGRCPAAVCRI